MTDVRWAWVRWDYTTWGWACIYSPGGSVVPFFFHDPSGPGAWAPDPGVIPEPE